MNGKENIMGTKKIFPLLMSMAIPPMISMLIQSLYNIVDGYFVAKMGQNELTAVSLAFPLQNICLAFAVGLGVALNSSISRSLGAKNKKEIEQAVEHGMVLSAIHSVILIVMGLCVSHAFISAFTSDSNIIKMGTEYSLITVCFSFGIQFHISIEKTFQAFGKMLIPMLLQAVGAITNIILDPILIFGMFGLPAMGVKGAAIATVIGQIFACFLSFVLFKKSKISEMSFKGFRFDKQMLKRLYSVAVPSALMTAMPSLLVTLLNGLLSALFTQTSVAVFGLYYKLQTFVNMPANGLIQGMRPIAGYNYGARNTDRLKSTVVCSINVTAVLMLIGTLISVLLPQQILKIFEADEQMMAIGVDALRILGSAFVISTVALVLSGVFEAIGKGVSSLIVSLLRQLVIVPPLSYVLALAIGLNGVWLSFPIAELIALVVSHVLLKKMKLFSKEKILSSN